MPRERRWLKVFRCCSLSLLLGGFAALFQMSRCRSIRGYIPPAGVRQPSHMCEVFKHICLHLHIYVLKFTTYIDIKHTYMCRICVVYTIYSTYMCIIHHIFAIPKHIYVCFNSTYMRIKTHIRDMKVQHI